MLSLKNAHRLAPALALGMSIAALSAAAAQAPAAATWLDKPVSTWNTASATLPKAQTAEEPKAALMARCKLTPLASTPGERSVDSAGWVAFRNFDQQLVRDDVEIVGGMTGADGMCRPMSYNLFVFVGGQYAGTLSPVLMNSRLDGTSGAVRLAPPTITGEFSRYTNADPLCCPSSKVTVTYRIDRSGSGATVVPVGVKTTRG